MKKHLLLLLISFLYCNLQLNAQEISRGFVLPLELGQGFTSSEASPPEIYLATVTIKPSYVFAKNTVRIGATGMLAYSDGLISYLGGPRVAVRIYQSNLGMFGEIFNIQVTSEALWGTRNKELFGGGFTFEADPAVLSLNAWQEYKSKELWFDVSFGVNVDRFFKKAKQDDDPFKN